MQTLLERFEIISNYIGRTVSYLLLAMTLIAVGVVIIRYLFQSGSIALQESITYFHAAVFILAAGYTLQNNGHVRVDIIYHRLSQKKQALVNLFGTCFFLLPFCGFTLWAALPYVQLSWKIGEKSADAGGLAAVFLLKSLIIALVVVLVFQALIELLRNVLVLKGEIKFTDEKTKEGI